MNPRTNRLGLALSGGGFRASLYHLGLVRWLRDGGILPRITHITSVSGGSIFAAHLVRTGTGTTARPASSMPRHPSSSHSCGSTSAVGSRAAFP